MKKELSTKYDHLEVEKGKYEEWLKEGYFTAGDKSKDHKREELHKKYYEIK